MIMINVSICFSYRHLNQTKSFGNSMPQMCPCDILYRHLGAISSLVSMHTFPVSRAMRSKTQAIRFRASTRCASFNCEYWNFIACLLVVYAPSV